MAKSGKKSTPMAPRPEPTSGRALGAAISVLARGDYLRARELLSSHAADPALSEGEREEARQLSAATRIERGTLLVGLGCLGLFLLVVLVTALTQP